MNRKNRLLAALLLCVVITASACTVLNNRQDQRGEGSPNGPMEAASDFTLSDLEGRKVRLHDLRGQKVLINFWTTWCPYCRDEMSLLQKFYEENKDKNWQVLTINITSSEKGLDSVQKYIKENGFSFPVLLDEKGSVSAQYGIRSIPASFILTEKGEILKTKVGPFTEKEIEELGRL